jgi:hypothetical protein
MRRLREKTAKVREHREANLSISGPGQYSVELRQLSEAAESGDFIAGERLLRLFADLAEGPDGVHPELLRHVAKCIQRVLTADVDARKALCIGRPANRTKDTGKIAERNNRGLWAYCAGRASGLSHDAALDKAVETVEGLTLPALKKVYDEAGAIKRNLLISLYTRELSTSRGRNAEPQ